MADVSGDDFHDVAIPHAAVVRRSEDHWQRVGATEHEALERGLRRARRHGDDVGASFCYYPGARRYGKR